MKKLLSVFFVLTVVSCMLFVCIPSVCAAESDSYYYYNVKVTTKIEGDIPSEAFIFYYSLHGVNQSNHHIPLDACGIDGNSSNTFGVSFQAGVTEQTNVLTYRSENPVIGARFLQEGFSSTDFTAEEGQYYLEFPEQTQQPGIENAMNIEQMCLIEGFEDGGKPILSELRIPSFTVKHNAPPIFFGVEDGGEYFTTHKVRVQDADLVSVMLDDEPVEFENGEALITIPGDTNKRYTITAKDAAQTTCQLTVTMHELSELMALVSEINEKNVKAEQEIAILATLGGVETVIEQEPDASAEEKARLDTMKEKLEILLSRIDEATVYKNSENVEKTEGITADNVKLEDKEILEKASSDLKKALEEYGGNYSDSEKEVLQKELTRISDALKAIEEMAIQSPETGDNYNITMWLTLIMLSGAAIVTFTRKIA